MMLDRIDCQKTLQLLTNELTNCKSQQERLDRLSKLKEVVEFLNKYPELSALISQYGIESEIAMKAVIAIGQGTIVFGLPEQFTKESLEAVIPLLVSVERFYYSMGGIVGYYTTVMNLICTKSNSVQEVNNVLFACPVGIDLSNNDPEIDALVRKGIEKLDELALLYPVGGAGDRLNLIHEETSQPLPAATLNYIDRTLLEGLLRDLQAWEFLYAKLMGKQLYIPVALMTSEEKDNHNHILKICEQTGWFGRPRDSFLFFTQPLVPVITEEGDWVMQADMRPMVKPGGHGVVWKLAMDSGVFSSLRKQGKSKLLVRQINNPVCGVDQGLLAFLGFGIKHDKSFGFASCERIVNAAEGMDVCVGKKKGEGYEYSITNVEYTEFQQMGIQDVPKEPGSPYSQFPANTNILFAKIDVLEEATRRCPIPGMLVNMKSTVDISNSDGSVRQVHAGRLESTMQNIADYIVDQFPKPISAEEQKSLRTYITFNERRKTLSVTKQLYQDNKSILGTPEGAFYEKLQNDYELLTKYCGIKVPAVSGEAHYLNQGPSFTFHYHPALGPGYQLISQKLKRGSWSSGSELELEIVEVLIEDLTLAGCLLVISDTPLGAKNEDGVIQYGKSNGRCLMKGVIVSNAGIDHMQSNQHWSRQISRKEAVIIRIHGNGEFVAENVTFKGNMEIEVPSATKVTAHMQGDDVILHSEPIDSPSWTWSYVFDSQDRIVLRK